MHTTSGTARSGQTGTKRTPEETTATCGILNTAGDTSAPVQQKRGPDWSDPENDLVVSAYFEMLGYESRQESYSKTLVRRKVVPMLSGRSEGAYERKMSNISSVMAELGLPWLNGYKPLPNAQKTSLAQAVERYLTRNKLPTFLSVDTPPTSTSDPRVSPPALRATSPQLRPAVQAVVVDFVRREGELREIGLAGEKFVLDLERRRLTNAGRADLAERVEHVSVSEGDGLGYDIRSFDVEGGTKYVEVKTTSGGLSTPFLLTANELSFAASAGDRYELHRVVEWGRAPKVYVLPSANLRSLRVVPTEYRVYPDELAASPGELVKTS